MFKGTKEVSEEEFTRRVEEIGGDYNAFTSHDFAAYFENVASQHIDVPIRLEADRLANLEFTEGEFKTEKMVVMEERRLRTQDSRRRSSWSSLRPQPFSRSLITGRSSVGWVISKGWIMGTPFASTVVLRPANGFIVVVGNFQKERLLPIISEAFGKVRSNGKPQHPHYQDAPQLGERRWR